MKVGFSYLLKGDCIIKENLESIPRVGDRIGLWNVNPLPVVKEVIWYPPKNDVFSVVDVWVIAE